MQPLRKAHSRMPTLERPYRRVNQEEYPRERACGIEDNDHGNHSTPWARVFTILNQRDLEIALGNSLVVQCRVPRFNPGLSN